MQEARLQIQLEQVINIRFRSAELENGLQLVEVFKTIDLLTDLRTGGRKRGGDDNGEEDVVHSEFS